MKKLNHLSEIYNHYDAFIIDLWGVMHNGINLNSKAVEVVENLIKNKKRITFLSNAPRPNKNVIRFLKKLNMNEEHLKHVLTSGEAAIKSLKDKKFGNKFFHLGPERDASLFEGLEKDKTEVNPEFLNFLLELRIGEILFQSIDHDGSGIGLDMSILNLIPENFPLPIILMGGIGKLDHFVDGLSNDKVDAVATANILNFIGSALLGLTTGKTLSLYLFAKSKSL